MLSNGVCNQLAVAQSGWGASRTDTKHANGLDFAISFCMNTSSLPVRTVPAVRHIKCSVCAEQLLKRQATILLNIQLLARMKESQDHSQIY